jgi:hypothetical protein
MADGIYIVDSTEAQLGARFADPATMRGRAPSGQRRWSLAAVEREVAYNLAYQHNPEAVRPQAPWDASQATRFPALRRLMVKSPEMAKALPGCLGPRPGTRYLEGEVDITRRGLSPTPVALDPGGDLANWQELGWVDKATATALRVSTDPVDHDAVLLATLDANGVDWSRPPRSAPVPEVVVDPKRVRRVGRISGVIDADSDGLPGDLIARRPVHQEADRLGAMQEEAKRLGPCTLSRLTGLPLRVAERASAGKPISARNVSKALAALNRLDRSRQPRCVAQGCQEPVTRRGARYHAPICRDQEKKRRKRARSAE